MRAIYYYKLHLLLSYTWTNCPWVSEDTSGQESKFYFGVGLGRSYSVVVMIYISFARK